jgi:hypothetical protein
MRRRSCGCLIAASLCVLWVSPAVAASDQLPPTISTWRGVVSVPLVIALGQQTVRASINPNGDEVTKCWVDWGPRVRFGPHGPQEFTDRLPCSPTPGSGSDYVDVAATFHVRSTGEYAYRFVAANGGGTTIGDTGVVMAHGYPPNAQTLPATEVTSHTVTLHGRVNPHGQPTVCSFEYGPTSIFGHQASCMPSLGDADHDVAVSATVAWQAGTVLHYRVTAANGSGTSRGQDSTVLVAIDPPPVIVVVERPPPLVDTPPLDASTEPPVSRPSGAPAASGMLSTSSPVTTTIGRFDVLVGCRGDSAVGCRGTLLLRTKARLHGRRRTIVLGTAAYALGAGEYMTLHVAVTRRARRLLAHHPRLHVTATTRPAGG